MLLDGLSQAKISSVSSVSPLQMTPEASPVSDTDWKKCVIYREDKNEKLLFAQLIQRNRM